MSWPPRPQMQRRKKSEARYTVKGLFGREVLYTARQKDSVLTLDVPAGSATFRTTVQDMQTLLNEGVSNAGGPD